MMHHVMNRKHKSLPIIAPMIFYTGKEKYSYTTNLLELFDDPLGIAKELFVGGTTTLIANENGSDIGSPALTGSILAVQGQTFEDSSTSASSTAASNVAFNGFAQPTLDSTNGGAGTEVTTTNAATVYIAGEPQDVTNKSIITNAYSLWVDSGNVQFDGDLNVTGTITSGEEGVTEPSAPTTSNLVNVGTIDNRSIVLVTNGVYRFLHITYEINPTAADTTTEFQFVLPDVVTNLVNKYQVVGTISGYVDADEEIIGNMVVVGVTGTFKAKVKFTSASTGDHLLQMHIQYKIV